MRNTQVYWKRSMPILTVTSEKSTRYGNCYHGTTYKVTTTQRLTKGALVCLFEAGVFGAGQEFHVQSPCDGKEEPAGTETVYAKEYDMSTWAVVNDSPVNDFSKQPYTPMFEPFYVYMVERRTDSGD